MKVSQIPNSGKGLFAKKKFEIDEIIGEFRGPIMKTEDCNLSCFDFEDRMVSINSEISMVGNSIVSYANDCIIFNE